MSFLASINSLLLFDIRTTLLSLAIGYVVFKVSRLFYQMSILPPGPIPIPFVGNLLQFRGTKENWSIELETIAKRYGPVMTLWMGNTPRVLISDIDIAREAFKKNDFAGRPRNILADMLELGTTRWDVVFSDYGHHWEALRRVSHSAVLKYSTTEKLNNLVIDCVDHSINTWIEREGFNKPFVPFEYIYHMFLNILSASAFGNRYELDNPEYKLIKKVNVDQPLEVNVNFFLWEIFSLYKNVDPRYKTVKTTVKEFTDLLLKKYQEHVKDYDETVTRDFFDSLITAKNEALRDNKESAPYLTDKNISISVFDLLTAGTATSQNTFRWGLLYMLYNKSIEKKLRQEIESEIGDRMPTHEDKGRCHYVMAFITETMRLSSIIPLGVPHKAVVTAKLGDYTIPQGTEVYTYQGHIMHQDENFANHREFRPERFLSNGQYVSTRPKAWIPFGVGRRVCLGEKMAIADLFLVFARFLQKTSDYELVLHMDVKDALYPDPNIINFFDVTTKPFEISFHKK